ncbi:MAG TPA: DUF503 domain-containing protein [Acidimicrobiia bacterium]|nr:DUF503 domain-containing protein [Acidimicrobiia bacterium]
MRAAALRVELHLPSAKSLKAKRAILRPLVEGIKRLGSLSVAEVDHHDRWQRAALGVAIATRDGDSLAAQIAKLRRYLDTRLEVEVLDIHISELEDPG